MSEPMLAFWANVTASSVIGTALITLPLRRGQIPRIAGVTPRDFLREGRIVSSALHDAAQRTVRGWRAAWPGIVFGLIAAGTQAAWNAAVSDVLGRSAWLVYFRLAVCIPASFWLMGRLVVASVHQHMHFADSAGLSRGEVNGRRG